MSPSRRHPSLRQLMILVAVAAVLMGGGIEVRKHQQLRHATRRLVAQRAFYDEGRITIDRLIDASRQVMEAEMVLCWGRRGRVAIVAAHVDRATRMVAEERRLLEGYQCWHTTADMAEAENALDDGRQQLRALVAAE